jgi:hypothetical protein
MAMRDPVYSATSIVRTAKESLSSSLLIAIIKYSIQLILKNDDRITDAISSHQFYDNPALKSS